MQKWQVTRFLSFHVTNTNCEVVTCPRYGVSEWWRTWPANTFCLLLYHTHAATATFSLCLTSLHSRALLQVGWSSPLGITATTFYTLDPSCCWITENPLDLTISWWINWLLIGWQTAPLKYLSAMNVLQHSGALFAMLWSHGTMV